MACVPHGGLAGLRLLIFQQTGLFVPVCAHCETCMLNLQVSNSNAKPPSHTFVYWTQSRRIYIIRCLAHRGVYLKIARDMRRGVGTCLGGAVNILLVGIGCGTKRLRSTFSSMLHLCSGGVICVPAGCTQKDHSLGGTILVPVTGSTSPRLRMRTS